MSSIFVQVAAYRDPELVPTLENCLQQAKHPADLTFGICRQFHPADPRDDLPRLERGRIRLLDVPSVESKGACWARSHAQGLYDGEDYTLQIDSHHRFARHWDELLVSMLQSLKSAGTEKPLLTSYLASFDPEGDPVCRRWAPRMMAFDRFSPEGAVLCLPRPIDRFEDLQSPIPARFFSAHFAFALGAFTSEVPYDPNLYFHGEEITMAVRAFTHGYDLFQPHRVVAWHDYSRRNRSLHWSDDESWSERNAVSLSRMRRLLNIDGRRNETRFGPYDLGGHRMLEDYERYAGLSFSLRAVQQSTLDHTPPPDSRHSASREAWAGGLRRVFKYDISKSDVPEQDYDFWAICFEDETRRPIFRKDAAAEEVRILMEARGDVTITRELPITAPIPKYWVVWPHSRSKGWCRLLQGTID
jgi:hypothetical protein